jgi:hypothetical protein
MPSPIELMLMEDRDPTMQRALAQGLRRQSEIGTLAQLTGDEVLAPFGRGLSERTDRKVRNEATNLQKKQQRDLTKDYYEQMARNSRLTMAMNKRQQDERERHNRETEKTAALRAESALSGAGFKAPSVSAQKKTQEAKESYDGIARVLKSYKPEYASQWGAIGEGTLTNIIGKKFGTEGMKDQARWWADYDLLYTLGRRNELFGSALTDSEIRAWEGANISPNSPPDVIERGLRTLSEIASKKLEEQYKNDAPLYKPEWVESMYAGIAPMPTFGDEVEVAADQYEASVAEPQVNPKTGNSVQTW